MPPWLLIRMSKCLPQMITVPIFKKKMQANAINSMAQDISANSEVTELEYINGYFLNLAEKVGVAVPHNEALYHLFKNWVSEGNQESVKPSKLLSDIRSFSNR